MKKIIKLSFLIVGVMLLGAGCVPAIKQNGANNVGVAPGEIGAKAPSTAAVMEKEKNEDAMIKSETKSGEVMKKSTGRYEEYIPEKIALAATGKVVLFFKASWCETCRGVDKDIIAHAALIPSNLTILKVDYDSSTALKQKYGVTYQHTFVQVDANGNKIDKWSGSPTLAELITHIK